MDQDGTWGTDIEMLSLAHLLQAPVFSYSQQYHSGSGTLLMMSTDDG